MTGGTFCEGVLADQVERDFVMVKRFAMRIQTIMAGHTVRPKRQNMLRSKCLIYIQMTVCAHYLVKGTGITFYVAILADKCCAVCFCFVSRKLE